VVGTDRCRRLARRSGIEIQDGDSGALLGEKPRGGEADPAPACAPPR
jgi:hypothetical protein